MSDFGWLSRMLDGVLVVALVGAAGLFVLLTIVFPLWQMRR